MPSLRQRVFSFQGFVLSLRRRRKRLCFIISFRERRYLLCFCSCANNISTVFGGFNNNSKLPFLCLLLHVNVSGARHNGIRRLGVLLLNIVYYCYWCWSNKISVFFGVSYQLFLYLSRALLQQYSFTY